MMGYPMTYARVVSRNRLTQTYGINEFGKPIREPDDRSVWTPEQLRQSGKAMIAGDMRRLETDTRDTYHLQLYAVEAGITPEQVGMVLDAFFADHFAPDVSERHREKYGEHHHEWGNYPRSYGGK